MQVAFNKIKNIILIHELFFLRFYLKSTLYNCGLTLQTSSIFPCLIKWTDRQNDDYT